MQFVSTAGGRAPAPDLKVALRPIVDLLTTELSQNGHPLPIQHVQQLVAAAFGFFSFKVMLDAKPRILIEKEVSQGAPPEFTQIRRVAIEARIGEILGLDVWATQDLANRVYQRILESRIRIDAVDAFTRGNSGGAILSALAHGAALSPPVNATVAIHAKLILPASPDDPLCVPEPDSHGRLGSYWEVLPAISEGGYRLWESPGREQDLQLDSSSRELVHLDRYWPVPLDRGEGDYDRGAEMGRGFCLVKHVSGTIGTGPYDEARVLVPTRHFRKGKRSHVDGPGHWRDEWHRGGWTNFSPGRASRPNQPIHRLPADYPTWPEVKFCETCRHLYADVVKGPLMHFCIDSAMPYSAVH